jgi:uncharacterized metal-binding protein YceD (DUF177 family)
MTATEPLSPAPEFSRIVSIARLGSDAAEHAIAAGESERAALARRFGLLALERLAATVRLTRIAGGVRLEATLEAAVVQECVVTIEPFTSTVSDSFALVYRRGVEAGEGAMINVGEDEDEPLLGDEIDIGEAVAQQLSLALDPYPRSPAAQSRTSEAPEARKTAAAPPEGEVTQRPFAELAKLLKK